MECHGNTLLPQFLGMYRLTVDGVETYMVVTRNVFSHRLTVHRKYDLKVRPWGRLGAPQEPWESVLVTPPWWVLLRGSRFWGAVDGAAMLVHSPHPRRSLKGG